MKKPFIFLAGTLCIIATISLLKLHLIDSQYATVVLSSPSPTANIAPTADVWSPAISTPDVTLRKTPLFPVAKKISASSKTVTSSSTAAAVITHQAPTVAATPANFDAVNTVARNAVVNITCTAPGADSPISGSGVLIDPRGVILTNAHVAQYVLLQDSGRISLSCMARIGSPAEDAWHVQVLYISSEWIRDHAIEIRDEHPLGTGENDYALLRVTGSATAIPVPPSFPSIAFNTNFESVGKGQQVLVASYPAGFAAGMAAFSHLALVSTITTIKDLFTFSDAHTADLISLGGIIVAQSGSSGGAVVDQWKNLVGIVATASTATETGDRDLRAITLSHIDQSITKETNKDLASYIGGNLDVTEAAFKKGLEPDLIKLLIDALTKK